MPSTGEGTSKGTAAQDVLANCACEGSDGREDQRSLGPDCDTVRRTNITLCAVRVVPGFN